MMMQSRARQQVAGPIDSFPSRTVSRLNWKAFLLGILSIPVLLAGVGLRSPLDLWQGAGAATGTPATNAQQVSPSVHRSNFFRQALSPGHPATPELAARQLALVEQVAGAQTAATPGFQDLKEETRRHLRELNQRARALVLQVSQAPQVRGFQARLAEQRVSLRDRMKAWEQARIRQTQQLERQAGPLNNDRVIRETEQEARELLQRLTE